MKNEITILCNSPQCLKEITSGNYFKLHESNIFTCNMAYSHFRTSGRHLNIFSDKAIIERFLNCDNWYDNYGTYQYDKMEFIIHCGNSEIENTILDYKISNATVKFSPVLAPGSSAINALLYLVYKENFDKITLVGYTLNEWESIKTIKELRSKLLALNYLSYKYKITNPKPFVFVYKKN